MKQRRATIVSTASLLFVLPALSANADVLVTKDGQRIETDGPWEVRGSRIIYTDSKGHLSSIRESEIDLEASEAATRGGAESSETAEDESLKEISTSEEPWQQRLPRRPPVTAGSEILVLTDDTVSGPRWPLEGVSDPDIADSIVGSWVGTIEGGKATLELRPDRSYTCDVVVMGRDHHSEGVWKVEDQELVLHQRDGDRMVKGRHLRRRGTLASQRIMKVTETTFELEWRSDAFMDAIDRFKRVGTRVDR